jgi:hypothetical protein
MQDLAAVIKQLLGGFAPEQLGEIAVITLRVLVVQLGNRRDVYRYQKRKLIMSNPEASPPSRTPLAHNKKMPRTRRGIFLFFRCYMIKLECSTYRV